MRVFKDRDYLLAAGELYFCVVGYTHPPDRVMAYLKYISAKDGEWGSAGRRFKRILPYYTIPHIRETLNFLRENFPEYVFHDRYLETDFSAVPLKSITFHFCPEERLRRLLEVGCKDELESAAVQLVSKLSEESRVSTEFFGVTGSILIGIHRLAVSDIDLTILGRENALKVKDALLKLYTSKSGSIKKFSGALMEEWCKSKAEHYPLTCNEAKVIYGRSWNRGIFNDVNFSVHPIRLDKEVADVYGRRAFRHIGPVEVEAAIKDASDSIFLPATYRVTDARVVSGVEVDGIEEVVSFEGLYGGIFREDEVISVRGILEEVRDVQSGRAYYRVVVGSLAAGGLDFIKPKEE
ncbi:MAG: hypothetical protein QXJ75_03185 [Candidatus Bathyarchaeia archaeon]